MTDTITATFKCKSCGTVLTNDGEVRADDANVTCSNPDCGASFGKWGDIKQRTRGEMRDMIVKRTREIFRRNRRFR